MVEPGTAISVSVRFGSCCFFTCVRHRILFLHGSNLNTLHDLLRVISHKHGIWLSVCPSGRNGVHLLSTCRKTDVHAGWSAFFFYLHKT